MPLLQIHIVGSKQTELTLRKNILGRPEEYDHTYSEKDAYSLVTKTLTGNESKNMFRDIREAKEYANKTMAVDGETIWANPIITVTLAATSFTFSHELELSSFPYTFISIDSVTFSIQKDPKLIPVFHLGPEQEPKYIAILNENLRNNLDYKAACKAGLQEYEGKSKWQRLTNSRRSHIHEVPKIRAEIKGSSFRLEKYLKEIQMREGILPVSYYYDYYGMLTAMRRLLNSEELQMKELEQELNTYVFADGANLICRYLLDMPSSCNNSNAGQAFTAQLHSDGTVICQSVTSSSTTPTDSKRGSEETRVTTLSIFQHSSSSSTVLEASDVANTPLLRRDS